MAGVAGALIGLTSGHQPAIAQAVALVQGDPSGRGCTTNFIGFGLGLENTVQVGDQGTIEDFNATDDTVAVCVVAAPIHEPVYTLDVLSWPEVVAGP